MKLVGLCKIELYRFFHSIEIVKYFVLIPIILFSMCYINIFSVRYDIPTSAVWNSMSSIQLYMIVTICVLIAIYIGREFRLKTINYEVIGDYSVCQIAVSKTVTCGILLSFIYTLCMLIYLILSSVFFSKELLFRIILLYVIHLHICSSSVLYVMLCKNGVLGGIIVFIRFYLGEILFQFLFSGFKVIEPYFFEFQVLEQWYSLINIEHPVKIVSVVFILVSSFGEYGMLLLLLNLIAKHFDFE